MTVGLRHQRGLVVIGSDALNDSTAGFSATTDAIVEITGFSGLLSNLAVV